MELSAGLDYARQHTRGVLTTLKADGRPQLSNIAYVVDDDGTNRAAMVRDKRLVLRIHPTHVYGMA